MNIETREALDKAAALQACLTTGHNWAEVHGYFTGQPDGLKCVDICACCGVREMRPNCTQWSWCVAPVQGDNDERQ